MSWTVKAGNHTQANSDVVITMTFFTFRFIFVVAGIYLAGGREVMCLELSKSHPVYMSAFVHLSTVVKVIIHT